MRMPRQLVGAAAVFGLAAAGLAVGAAPASAATSYNGACGSGYGVIDSMRVGNGGDGYGTIYLTYNSSNGYNCLVTVRDSGSSASFTAAWLRVSGGSWHKDEGIYSSYAGPLYVHAANSCVDWGGWVGADSYIKINYNDHCS